MWDHMSGYGGWGGMGFGMIGMSLFWIFLLIAIVVLINGRWRPGAPEERRPDKTALDVVKERYARGEIDKDEFEQKKLALSK